MKITDLNNLWLGYNRTEDFRILICAFEEDEAQKLADEYCRDAVLNGKFEISEFTDPDVCIDCDYIIASDYDYSVNSTLKDSESAKVRREIADKARKMLLHVISDEYVGRILQHQNNDGKTVIDLIVDDVMECSAYEDEGIYNEDDIRLAVGRVMLQIANIDI